MGCFFILYICSLRFTYMVYLSRNLKKIVNNPHTLFTIMQKVYERELLVNPKRKDYMWIGSLGEDYRLLDLVVMPQKEVAEGSLEPAKVFKFATYMEAKYVVAIQTDPTGNWEITKQIEAFHDMIAKAGEALRMPLAEYMLMNTKAYYSFRMEGII